MLLHATEQKSKQIFAIFLILLPPFFGNLFILSLVFEKATFKRLPGVTGFIDNLIWNLYERG